MDRPRVLVVEDEENVRRLISIYLRREGFDVVSAVDGNQALHEFRRTSPHLIILDLMLPKVDGWDVCRRIRSESEVPIIMLTARGEEIDRILGLELGADDYVTKPFSPKELVLRVQAVLRRTADEWTEARERLTFPELQIDRARRLCFVHGEPVGLTRKEFDLLWYLARHPGRAFEREQLLERVWGFDYEGDPRTIDVHITRLREKLEGRSRDGRSRRYTYLQTVWGIGYKFEVIQAEA